MRHSNGSAARISQSLPEGGATTRERQFLSPSVPSSPRQDADSDVDTTETLLPAQFFTPGCASSQVWTGERRLMLSVLEEAVRLFFQHRFARSNRGKKLFSETERWFWSTDRHWLYAFESICDYLGLNPDYLRAGLQRRQPPSAQLGSFEDIHHNTAAAPSVPIFFRLGAGPATRISRGARSSSSRIGRK